MPLAVARAEMARIVTSPTLQLLAETDRPAEVLDDLLGSSGASGNLVHDAHIAALCLEHGVTELLTMDRDFSRFSGLRSTAPF